MAYRYVQDATQYKVPVQPQSHRWVSDALIGILGGAAKMEQFGQQRELGAENLAQAKLQTQALKQQMELGKMELQKFLFSIQKDDPEKASMLFENPFVKEILGSSATPTQTFESKMVPAAGPPAPLTKPQTVGFAPRYDAAGNVVGRTPLYDGVTEVQPAVAGEYPTERQTVRLGDAPSPYERGIKKALGEKEEAKKASIPAAGFTDITSLSENLAKTGLAPALSAVDTRAQQLTLLHPEQKETIERMRVAQIAALSAQQDVLTQQRDFENSILSGKVQADLTRAAKYKGGTSRVQSPQAAIKMQEDQIVSDWNTTNPELRERARQSFSAMKGKELTLKETESFVKSKSSAATEGRQINEREAEIKASAQDNIDAIPVLSGANPQKSLEAFLQNPTQNSAMEFLGAGKAAAPVTTSTVADLARKTDAKYSSDLTKLQAQLGQAKTKRDALPVGNARRIEDSNILVIEQKIRDTATKREAARSALSNFHN